MLTGEIKTKVDQIWNAFWSGGISNPLEVMEQITYLLFLKRLDEIQTLKENKANRLGEPLEDPVFPAGLDDLGHPDHPKGRPFEDYRWSHLKGRSPAEILREHQDTLAVEKVHRNRPVTASDLAELERILVESGIGTPDDVARARTEAGSLGLFVRSLVGLDRAAAKEALGEFLDGSTWSANQIEFVNLIVDDLTRHGVVEARRIYEPPFTDVSPEGPEAIFTETQVDRLVDVLATVRQNADVA